MPTISFASSGSSGATYRFVRPLRKVEDQIIGINQTYLEKFSHLDSKQLLIKQLLTNQLSHKNLAQIRAYCYSELNAINCIIAAHGRRQIAIENLIHFYQNKHEFNSEEHIAELMYIFQNQRQWWTLDQVINRSAAHYLLILLQLLPLVHGHVTQLAPGVQANLSLALKAIRRSCYPNYAKQVEVTIYKWRVTVNIQNSSNWVSRNNLNQSWEFELNLRVAKLPVYACYKKRVNGNKLLLAGVSQRAQSLELKRLFQALASSQAKSLVLVLGAGYNLQESFLPEAAVPFFINPHYAVSVSLNGHEYIQPCARNFFAAAATAKHAALISQALCTNPHLQTLYILDYIYPIEFATSFASSLYRLIKPKLKDCYLYVGYYVFTPVAKVTQLEAFLTNDLSQLQQQIDPLSSKPKLTGATVYPNLVSVEFPN